MIEHLAAMLVSAIAFLGAILLYGAFSPRRLGGWKFWICFAAYCVLMEGAGPLANGLYSVYGIIGSGVGRQMLYNTTIYCLLYVVLYKERPMVYLSITVVPIVHIPVHKHLASLILLPAAKLLLLAIR